MSESLIDFDEILNDTTLFPESEEVPLLDNAIEEIENLQDELQSTIDFVQELSEKYLKQPMNYLQSISPDGTSWSKIEYLPWNVDAMINEQCQKHDSDSPQQHHKVQEMNDDSSFLSPSTASSEIINHQTEAYEDSEFEGCDEDEKSSDQQPGEGVYRTVSEISAIYSKFQYQKIRLRYKLDSALIIVNRMMTKSKMRAIATRYYAFKKEALRYKTPFTVHHPRIVSSSSSSKKNPLKLYQLTRSASFSI
jgi:hypothetical protein